MQPTQVRNIKAVMAVSLELSGKSWKLAVTDGQRERPSLCVAQASEPGRRVEEMVQRIDQLAKQWGLPEERQVVVIYEAGQDAFWIARALAARGMRVLV